MHDIDEHRSSDWIASLRGFIGAQPHPAQKCELCSAPIDDGHAHLIEPQSRRILCACQPCVLLFDSPDARRYRRIPRSANRLYDFKLSDAQWDAFLIPINMAFFFHSSPLERVVAIYPGPAGAMESMLDLGAWNDLAEANPLLDEFDSDVESLLVNRVEGAREYYRVPIDRCYELVGLIRSHWHGLSGGQAVQDAIERFFQRLREETGNGRCAERTHA